MLKASRLAGGILHQLVSLRCRANCNDIKNNSRFTEPKRGSAGSLGGMVEASISCCQGKADGHHEPQNFPAPVPENWRQTKNDLAFLITCTSRCRTHLQCSNPK